MIDRDHILQGFPLTTYYLIAITLWSPWPRANMTLLTILQPMKPNTWPDRRLSSRRAFSNRSSVRGTHIYRLETEVPRVFQTHLDEIFTHEKSTSRCVIGPSRLLAPAGTLSSQNCIIEHDGHTSAAFNYSSYDVFNRYRSCWSIKLLRATGRW